MTSRGVRIPVLQSPASVDGGARRRFLRQTVVGGVSLAGALPVVASALSAPSGTAAGTGGEHDGTAGTAAARGRADDPLLEVLRRHGGEFGGIDRFR